MQWWGHILRFFFNKKIGKKENDSFSSVFNFLCQCFPRSLQLEFIYTHKNN